MSKKLRFAVIGVNNAGIGNKHAQAVVDHKDAELAAICEIDEKYAKERAELYGAEFWCTDYHDLLDRDDIDAVCVCTPDFLHHDMTADFLRAGKHVLCEKPLTLTSEQAKVILDAEKESKAKFMVGQVCRKTPVFKLAKEIIDKGIIGDLTVVESEYGHDYNHVDHPGWRQDKKHLRHIITGGGCHSVDLLRWIAGNPEEVFSYSNKKMLGDIWPVPDSTMAVMKFPNDVIGRVFASMGIKGRGTGIRTVIYGTKGVIKCSVDEPALTLNVVDFNGTTEFLGRNMDAIDMKLNVEINSHNVYAEICDFIDIILNNKEVELSAIEGANTVAVCEAIIKSSYSGEAEKVEYLG